MPRVGERPGADLRQGVDEGRGRRAVVDVLDVEDLQARLAEPGVDVGAGVLAQPLEGLPHRRLGIVAALGVGEEVQLDLADAAVELLGERPVRVVEPLGPALAARGDQAQDVRGRGDVVGVVRADDLDLVEPGLVARGDARESQQGGRDESKGHG